MVMIIITILYSVQIVLVLEGGCVLLPQPPLQPGSDHVVRKGGVLLLLLLLVVGGSSASGGSDRVSAAVSAGGGG